VLHTTEVIGFDLMGVSSLGCHINLSILLAVVASVLLVAIQDICHGRFHFYYSTVCPIGPTDEEGFSWPIEYQWFWASLVVK